MTAKHASDSSILTFPARAVARSRAARAERAEHRALVRELGSYRTQSDISELLALVDNRDDADSELLRTILVGTMQEQQRAS